MSHTPDIQDFLVDCTVRVESSGRRGTGFFIAPGLVLTCAHVIEDAASGDYTPSGADIHWGGGQYAARVVRYGGPVPAPILPFWKRTLRIIHARICLSPCVRTTHCMCADSQARRAADPCALSLRDWKRRDRH